MERPSCSASNIYRINALAKIKSCVRKFFWLISRNSDLTTNAERQQQQDNINPVSKVQAIIYSRNKENVELEERTHATNKNNSNITDEKPTVLTKPVPAKRKITPPTSPPKITEPTKVI